jgi:hypothetical protein
VFDACVSCPVKRSFHLNTSPPAADGVAAADKLAAAEAQAVELQKQLDAAKAAAAAAQAEADSAKQQLQQERQQQVRSMAGGYNVLQQTRAHKPSSGRAHQLALITSLPFVHTARRSYRLGVLVKCSDWQLRVATPQVHQKRMPVALALHAL